MKKLTAGIFTVLMGLVTVNAAEAAVASKGYVDTKVGTNTSAIETLTQTVDANKTAAENAIAAEQTAREQADNALETAYKKADTGLDTRLQEVEGKFSGNGEGSVAKQIADAVAAETSAREAADETLQGKIDEINDAENGILAGAKDYTDAEVKKLADGAVATNTAAITAINNADTGILKQAKDYTDGLDAAQKTAFENADKAISDKIGTVPADKTVVGMIADAQTAATYNDTEVRGLISDNADAIDAIENSAYAKSGITAEKVSIYDGYNATITANTDAAAAAQATADAAIPAPTDECANPTNKCVLTYNNAKYVWEVIERATGETVE